MKLPLIFLLLASLISVGSTEASLVRLDVSVGVFSSNAQIAYPSVDIDAGDTATFSLTYDSDTIPDVTSPGHAEYNIIGAASLSIGSFSWEANKFLLVIEDNPQFLTPTDSITLYANLAPSSPFNESFHQISFEVRSDPSQTMLSSTDLPSGDGDIDTATVMFGSFSVIPPSGTLPRWSIGGSEFRSLTVTPIPEPCLSSLLTISALAFLFRRHRK